MIVDCAIYRNGSRTKGPEDFSDAVEAARKAGDTFVWIGLHEPTEDEFALVTDEFGLHPLAVEDAVRAHQRPKLESYDDSLFLVLKTVGYDDEHDTVHTGELMMFVGDAFVVTVRHGPGSPLAQVRKRLEEQPDVMRHGPGAVMYAVCDEVVDTYLDISAELQVDLEELEASVFAPQTSRSARGSGSVAERIYGFKRQIVEFRRATAPLQDPVARLTGGGVPFVPEGTRPFFRDVGDHLARANEQVEALDRLLSDILSANLAQVSVQQNNDMRKISAWAALAAVPTMIAGIYGMNFTHMPELRQVWGYPAVLLLMAGVCAGLYRVFKRSGWL
ncbi:magnesium/cobalt transporter CorA [Streptacidiphilus sp. ASG 303]|uniref:magnesium/cobalt transporter CorA n=1 Tax=Streptacidiphilus sp. ASG 303 TaxID=2896847 RepID=UPI001E5AA6F7|nr:magnesium/cobalt transporter CorA [Streptacidiphilus sp. ASG 303]MCD0481347.1 magnesium/cobalt transporter CorA [Streptacidiphilus sp. ASG 303]